MVKPLPDTASSADGDSTRLPMLRSWAAVYAFAIGMFVLWVTLLVVLEKTFS
jgi:hypothetical protein